jgi:hypothetical protein
MQRTGTETLLGPAAVEADITKHVRAEFVPQLLLQFVTEQVIEFGCCNRPRVIIRRPTRHANKFKAEGEPYKGQREDGRVHWSHQQLES